MGRQLGRTEGRETELDGSSLPGGEVKVGKMFLGLLTPW
jgi:hypothetical protein